MIYEHLSEDLDLCDYAFMRYWEKRFTQIYRALYGDAMLVPIQMDTYMLAVK